MIRWRQQQRTFTVHDNKQDLVSLWFIFKKVEMSNPRQPEAGNRIKRQNQIFVLSTKISTGQGRLEIGGNNLSVHWRITVMIVLICRLFTIFCSSRKWLSLENSLPFDCVSFFFIPPFSWPMNSILCEAIFPRRICCDNRPFVFVSNALLSFPF